MFQFIDRIKKALAAAADQAGQMEAKSKMRMNQVSDDFYVSGQVGFSDLPALAEQGIKSLICARPDDEEGNQPRFADLAKEAKALGIEALHVPISPGQATPDAIAKFGKGYAKMAKPVLGYCRSGARAHSLYEMSK